MLVDSTMVQHVFHTVIIPLLLPNPVSILELCVPASQYKIPTVVHHSPMMISETVADPTAVRVHLPTPTGSMVV
jgi:hypothetical protein